MKIRISFFIVAVLLLPQAVKADLRINRRDSHKVDFTIQNDDVYYYHDYREEIPSYLPDEPEVMQSLLVRSRFVNWDGTDSGWSETTLSFDPEVVYTQTGKELTYYDLTPGTRRVEQYDQEGRLVSLSRINYSRSDTYHYFYGNYSYPDSSIHSSCSDEGITNFIKYISQYDANGLKLEEIVYVSADSLSWTPNMKYVIHNSGQVLPEGFLPRKNNPLFDVKVFGYIYNILQDYYQCGIYGRAMVDSVQTFSYQEGAWNIEELHLYSYGANTDQINIGVAQYNLDYMMYPDYWPSQFGYSFTSEGYLVGQYWGVDDGLAPPTWGSTTYSWEVPTSSSDPIQIPSPAPTILAYPNPFHQATNINLRLPTPGYIKLEVFNVRGQLIRSLLNDYRGNREYQLAWDGRDNNGRELAVGIYFLKLVNGTSVTTAKLIRMN